MPDSPSQDETTPSAASRTRTRTLHFQAPDPAGDQPFARTGLEHLRAVQAGAVPDPPISSHIDMRFVRIEEGDVVMTAEPHESHYNPIGSVHGGFFATLLDSVCGCAVHSTLLAGVGYTSLEIKVSFLRPITAQTGTVTAHGWVTKRGRSAAFVDADIRDRDDRILATASSTCLIFPIPPGS